MRLLLSAVHFCVPDVLATADYYRNVLGFTVAFFGDPPVFASAERDAVLVHFNDIPQSTPKPNPGVACDLYVFTDDLDELFEELKGKGADIVEGPVLRPYQVREFVVRDLNGYEIAFGQDVSRA